MYAEVAVETKIPSIAKTYTYLLPDELVSRASIGSPVDVPFGKKNLQGVICRLTNTPPDIKVKEVHAIIQNEFPLTKGQIDLALWISFRYLANLYDCIRLFSREKTIPKENPISKDLKSLEEVKTLTEEQLQAYTRITESLLGKTKQKQFLLHGVTGSGKTEIYLQTAASIHTLSKQVLFLVPEISLTPQLIQRFSARFGKDAIAVIHSRRTGKEKSSEWERIRSGEATVVVGSRSAIFSPFKNLGAILIDECHEQSYRQDKTPCYDTIEIARYLSQRDNMLMVMGSATPLIEQYYEAKQGKYILLPITKRISNIFPTNIIVDMKGLPSTESKSLISPTLADKLIETYKKGGQSILYYNRRGLQSGLICSTCGATVNCPHCDMPYTIHTKKNIPYLACHYCYRTEVMPKACPSCSSIFIRGRGSGTEKIKNIVQTILSESTIAIMDKDSTAERGSHERIFHAFAEGKTDVLIGTQMITKGWDIPAVSLTSYLLFDSDTIFPSFRTGERTYQTLTQLAGRSGRGKTIGENIIQTYTPENKIIETAIHGNYEAFYNIEIVKRKELGYPPFTNLIQLVAKSKKQGDCLKEIRNALKIIEEGFSKHLSKEEYSLLGPSSCFLPKMKNDYYIQATVKCNTTVSDTFTKCLTILSNLRFGKYISVRVNPFELL